MKKLILFILAIAVNVFVLTSSHDVHAQTSCAGYGQPNFCTTGNQWTGPQAICEYKCRYDGYTCTPKCDNVTYFDTCVESPTVHCTQVQIGCRRCGNTEGCFTKTVVTPPITPPTATPTLAPPPEPPAPPECVADRCDAMHSCKVYVAPPNTGSICRLGQQIIASGECIPDTSCAQANTCEPTNGSCMQPGQCSRTPNPNFTCSGVGQICCPNPPPANTNTPVPQATNTPVPQPTATPGACQIGQSCSCSGADAGHCAQCDGGWCNGGQCETCQACVGAGCSGNGNCSVGKECDVPPQAGITPYPGNRECYNVPYPDRVGLCCKPANWVRGQQWEVTSCGVAPSNAPTITPTPTPTYIPITGIVTPTPRPTGTGSGAKPAQSWKCLKSEPYDGPLLADGTNSDHQLHVTGLNFPKNKNIFIVGCALLNGSFQCTTGDSTLDSTLQIRKSPEHEFAVLEGPIKITTDGQINTIIRSHTQTSTIHTFFGVYSLGPDGGQNDDSGNSLQFGTFDSNSNQVSYKCTGVRWDPYGRVFDSKSLEPIPNINLELLNENKSIVMIPGLINPDFTDQAGGFNFLVEPGTYYLNPLNLKNYTFVGPDKVPAEANKAYSNIYTPGEKIVEKAGKEEHRDIALDPGKNVPKEYKPTSIEFTVLPVPGTNQTRLVGQVSHPLTIVSFKQNEKEIGKTVADKFGYYELLVDNKEITPGVAIVPAFKKVALITQNPANMSFVQKIASFFKSIFTPTNAAPEPAVGAAVEPIPDHLEGYIYGSLNQKMANANVELILSMSDQPVYQVKSDANGLIMIPHEYMPIFPMYIKVTAEGSSTSFNITISQFMEQNRSYLQEKNINLMDSQ